MKEQERIEKEIQNVLKKEKRQVNKRKETDYPNTCKTHHHHTTIMTTVSPNSQFSLY